MERVNCPTHSSKDNRNNRSFGAYLQVLQVQLWCVKGQKNVFAVDPHFADAVTWELVGAVLGCALLMWGIVWMVRRLTPAPPAGPCKCACGRGDAKGDQYGSICKTPGGSTVRR